MSSRTARVAAPVLGVALLSGTAVAVTALPATAVENAPTTSQSVQVTGAASVKKTAKKKSKVVSDRQVRKYKLSKKMVRDIAKAKKFAKTKKAKQVRQRESHSRYKINTGNGYYGAYQFDKGTWRSNGGKKFSKTANKAPKWAQDYVMWRTHKARGWSPWGG